MIDLRSDGTAILLPVKIVPGASRTRYLGEWDKRAKIAVAAPPERGKANQAVADFLADLLRIRRRDVLVVSGHTTPTKTVRIEGVTADVVRTVLKLK